jgi:hypothetical protein
MLPNAAHVLLLLLLLSLLQRTDGRAGFFLRKPRWFEGHLFHPFLFNDVTSVDCTGGRALRGRCLRGSGCGNHVLGLRA